MNSSLTLTPESIINSYRRFGGYGTLYQVISLVQKLDNNDAVMRIKTIEPSGREEELDLHFSDIVTDPQEA